MARPVLLIYERVPKTQPPPPATPAAAETQEPIIISESPSPSPALKKNSKEIITFPSNSPPPELLDPQIIISCREAIEDLDKRKKNANKLKKKLTRDSIINSLLSNLDILEKIRIKLNLPVFIFNNIKNNTLEKEGGQDIILETMNRLLLKNDNYLDDVAINAGLNLIDNFADKNKKNAALFITFLTTKFYDQTKTYENYENWSKKYGNLNTKDVVIFPFNLTNYHWLFIAVNFQDKKILYYDSAFTLDNNKVELVQTYLKNEEVKHEWINSEKYRKGEFMRYTIEDTPTQKQKDNFSCGEFVYRNIETLVFNLTTDPLDINNMNYYYHLHALELLEGSLMLERFITPVNINIIQDEIITHLDRVYTKFRKTVDDFINAIPTIVE